METFDQLDQELRRLIDERRRAGTPHDAAGIAAVLYSQVSDGAEHVFLRHGAFAFFTERARAILEA